MSPRVDVRRVGQPSMTMYGMSGDWFRRSGVNPQLLAFSVMSAGLEGAAIESKEAIVWSSSRSRSRRGRRRSVLWRPQQINLEVAGAAAHGPCGFRIQVSSGKGSGR